MDSSAGLLFSLAKRVLRLRKPLVIIDPALTDTYRLRRRIHDLALPAANAVVVFGAVQQDYLEKCYGGRVHAHLVRHRIDARFFSPDPAAPEPERPYVLSVGDDVGRDFDTLITAAQGLDIQVIIKSSRSVRTALPSNVRVIPDRVTFEELRSLYQGARLVVLPLHRTLHASGVNTVLESMAMQKAVVVSDSEGLRDYVEHGRTAWVVPSGEPEPLRVAMLKLWHDGALRSALGRNARQFCLARCSMPVYMRTVAAIIGNCLKK
jgi:glycosyltransferase involved in cell wall biosynthesis